jgi:rare lipoprotein A
MLRMFDLSPAATILVLSIVGVADVGCQPHSDAARGRDVSQHRTPSGLAPAATKPQPDLSGRSRYGYASFYAKQFGGREMADGAKMDLQGDNAASKTLPLGTRAKVTNIGTGQSVLVTIQDRGPYVKGRIMDLSPAAAQKIGITQDNGIAKVKVTPISVPLPNGSAKPGIATQDPKS